jgi:hypothetical protein
MKRKRIRKHDKKSDYKISQGKEDVKQRKKYVKGGRIEAYTFGEALGKKKDKTWG